MDKNFYKSSGWYNSNDVMDILECGKTKAYEVIQQLNKKRAEKNLLVIKGRIPAVEFNNYLYGELRPWLIFTILERV